MKQITKNLLIGSAFLAGSSIASAASVFSAGHADVIALGYEGGAFEPHFHYDDDAVIDGSVAGTEGEFEPDEVITLVTQTTFDYIEDNGGRPAGGNWDPVGVGAGESFWFLPQNSTGPGGADTLGVPFAGIGMEELTASDWTGNIDITLTGVGGPGEFSLWADTIAGPDFIWSTVDGLDASDVHTQAPGTHSHYNWGFTELGTYDITVEFEGEHVTDGTQTASATYSFNVIPEPSSSLLVGLGLFAGLIRRRR